MIKLQYMTQQKNNSTLNMDIRFTSRLNRLSNK